MKFKRVKFMTMILIFTMLLGGLLPAFSNKVLAGSYEFTLGEGNSEGVYKFFSGVTFITNGQTISVEFVLRNDVSIVRVPGEDSLYLRKNDYRI